MNIFVFRVGVLDNHSFDTAVLLSGTARRNRVGRFWFLEGLLWCRGIGQGGGVGGIVGLLRNRQIGNLIAPHVDQFLELFPSFMLIPFSCKQRGRVRAGIYIKTGQPRVQKRE